MVKRNALLVVVTCSLVSVPASPAAGVPDAQAILDATGVKGGLVVHLGCGNGKHAAELGAMDGFLVHGLDADGERVNAARAHIRSAGLYGTVSVERLAGPRLPYADDLVNLLVAENLGAVPMAEVLRVLVPRGVAYIKRDGAWTKTVKPRPDGIDDWTHFLHSASNNAVARDTQVGPPRRLKWVCGPLWSRSHEFVSSIPAMISAGGRVFYVFDEGLTSLTDAPLPERWMLIGRDAFNGVLLWKRPLPKWRGNEWKSAALRARPESVPRRIVTDGAHLYATLSHRAPLAVLDPATGKTLRTIDGTDNTQEILLSGRTLVLRLAGRGGRRGKPSGSIVALDADTGRIRWQVPAAQYAAASLAVDDGRVVYSTGSKTVCLNLADGTELWRKPGLQAKDRRARESVLILHGDVVLDGNNSEVVARSAETGETRWTARGQGKSMRGYDLFVAQGCAWHATADGITGYDLVTGEPAKVIDPSSVQSAGHHLRCYRAKATERFLITQFRGAEFVSLTDDGHANNDWIRGACVFGVMPCNGLLYVPPNPCFCYPGVKLTGLLALAPAGNGPIPPTTADQPRLLKGPAFGKAKPPSAGQQAKPDDWPTYRHDARRSGATASTVPAQVSTQWTTRLPALLTPPVVAGGRVYVAAKDEHTLYALNADTGGEAWHFTAGGRIDSPPTVHGELVLFGSADGAVYCVRASDGELVWRFRAAPSEQRVVAFGRLESPWRVHGSILLEDGVAYCTAGRSTFLDGGIWIFGLDPMTGKVLHETHLDTAAPTRADAVDKPFIPSYHMEGTHSDILVSQGDSIYLGQYRFDRKLARQAVPYGMPDPDNEVVAMDISREGFTLEDPALKEGYQQYRNYHRYMERAHPEMAEQYTRKYGGMNMGDRHMGMRVMATGGFLDDTWFNRTFWMYSANWPGWYLAHRGAKSGQILVVGPERTYALQAFPTRNRQSPLFEPGGKGYLLLADENDNEPVLDDKTRGATKGMGFTRLRPPAWYRWIPIRVRGMVVTGKHLFIAGPPDVVDADDPMAAFEGRKGAVLRAYAPADGNILAERKLDAPPIFDGLIAAAGRLFMCTIDGHVVCLADR